MVLCLLLLLLSSCIGVNMDIVLNANGRGTIALEYRINKSLSALGELDGNEKWETIPVGMADFERTLERLPDMKLLSFSSKEEAAITVISARMEFGNMDSLFAFLDASGQRSSFSGDARSGRMVLTLSEGSERKNKDFNEFLAGICEGHAVRVSFSFPAEGKLTISDRQGRALEIKGSDIKPRGKSVYFTLPIYEVLTSTNGINAEFQW